MALLRAGARSLAGDSRRFFLIMAALAGTLLAVGVARWYVTSAVYDPAVRQAVLFARAVTDSHEAMLDQETGLRGYQATRDARFLEPYRDGQADYRQASARAWELVAGDELRERLRAVQDRADAWRTEHAVPQLTAPPGQAGVPPQAATLAAGKSLFDAYRAPAEQLLAAARSRNSALLQRNAQVNQQFSAVEVALAGAALLLAARRHRHVTAEVTRPVQEVTDVLHRLAAGEETTRPQPYPTREFAELSAGVRALADAAQSRREDADAQKAAAAARARVYEQVLAVAHEFSAYLNPHEIAGALLEALRNLAGADAVTLRTVDQAALGPALTCLPAGAPLPADDLAEKALRLQRLTLSPDRYGCAAPVTHGATVHALLQVHVTAPLTDDQLLALRNLTLAAAGALTAAQLHARVHAESRTDALTGLHNRRQFEEDLHRELAVTARTGVPLSLLLLDVDHFKRFNDTRGHREGDRLLHTLGSLIPVLHRGSDSGYRYGGEELAVLLRGTDTHDALTLAERLRTTIADRTPVTVSIGVATTTGGLSPDTLVEAADQALYQAKQNGRNAVRRSPGPVTKTSGEPTSPRSLVQLRPR